MSILIRKLSPALGAEVTGVDLGCPLDEETVRAIAGAWKQHGVLTFPDQPISDEAHARLGRYFGELVIFDPGAACEGGVPEVFHSANSDPAGNLTPEDSESAKLLMLNWLWHTDSSYRPIPTRGAILHGIEVIDDGGGDTVFANMIAAYEALPVAMQRRIAGLFARHSFEFMIESQGLPPLSDGERTALSAVNHPLLRHHPDGRKSLYLSPPYMEEIVGWSHPDSMALIEELTAWAGADRFVYRHQWRPHDLVMWDNGSTMHKVTPYDIARQSRVMHGVVFLGSEPIEPVFTAEHQRQS